MQQTTQATGSISLTLAFTLPQRADEVKERKIQLTLTDSSGRAAATVHLWDAGYQEATALYTIYSLTGSNRDEEAVKDGRFALYRAEGIAYAAKLEPEAAHYGITEETLIESFRLIRQDWRTGET